jgi:2-C-methyl-D-erythritol 4-phosphate cytidylyltransferase
MRVTAIIVAAGQGARMGSELPKVFLPLAGTPILVHTLRAVSQVMQINQIVVVVAEGTVDRFRILLDESGPWPVPIQHAIGGTERQDSVAAGLAAVSVDAELVAVHDGARPFVSPAAFTAAIEAAAEVGAALLAIPSRDTVKLVHGERLAHATPPRSTVWLAQTPQVFRTALLRDAHARARRDGVIATDDAALVERLGLPVQVVMSDAANLKITTPDDLRWAEWYLQTRGAPR